MLSIAQTHIRTADCQDASAGAPATTDCGATWLKCANERFNCECRGEVRFGKGDVFTDAIRVSGSVDCSHGSFGWVDPVPGQKKVCHCRACDPATSTTTTEEPDLQAHDNPAAHTTWTDHLDGLAAKLNYIIVSNQGCCRPDPYLRLRMSTVPGFHSLDSCAAECSKSSFCRAFE